ncbi:SRPBCC domain-containing protein [Enterococcus sp. BWR-S5]|uniref:SRPBCC domain-containing protein n=1 Tax=Enterococcus sp. BWR-S5 TaxID=2787714 RepID=UPI0019231EAF|nr:SRPBCC domain-containing protein [Enterococcus sp. BWR-S5]MBL1226288.1 SRPBCC domain-containing protein [Enterococcus sp. BWR-S5]
MKLYQREAKIYFQQELAIDTSISEVWQLLTTTAGLEKWFPELKAEQLAEKKILTFEADGFKADMEVLAYEEPVHFKIMWDSGEVSFRLKELLPQETRLEFLEVLPMDFPNLYQDIAGWHYVLKRLKAAAEGKEEIFTPECIKQKAQELERMMREK